MKSGIRFAVWCLGAFVSLSVCGQSALASDTIYFKDTGNSAAVTISVFGGAGKSTVAGDYNIFVNGSATATAAFCTDVYDTIYKGETWSAVKGLTFDLLPTTGYPHGGVKNVPAIDFIAQHYSATPYDAYPSAAAAQLAIWDLSVGGHVSLSGGSYLWDSSTFKVTSGFANSSDQANLAKVFSLEQNALFLNPGSSMPTARTGPSGSSIWIPVQTDGHWSSTNLSYGRPQDMVTFNRIPQSVLSVPEPSFVQMPILLSLVGVVTLIARRRKKAVNS